MTNRRMMRAYVAGCVLALGLFYALEGCSSHTAGQYYKQAGELEDNGNYTGAIKLLDKVIELEPEHVDALLDRAVDKSLVNDHKRAIDDYTHVLNIQPDNTLALLNRAKNKKRLSDWKGTVDDLDKAIATKGGELIYIDKKPNELVATGWQYDATMEEIRFERGIAFYYLDSFGHALNDFNFCIGKNFEPGESFYWRGVILLSLGKHDKGCEDLVRATGFGDDEARKLLEQYCK